MLTAGDLMDQARDLHPSFDEQSHPDITILRELDRYQKELWSECLIRDPAIDSAEQEIAAPITQSQIDDGIPLVSTLGIREGEVRVGERTFELVLLPMSSKTDPKPMFSGLIERNTLFLRGNANFWSNSSIVIRYYDQAPTLTDEDSELILMDNAAQACVYRLAAFMAMRGSRRADAGKADVDRFSGFFRESQEKYLTSLWHKSSSRVVPIREVW